MVVENKDLATDPDRSARVDAIVVSDVLDIRSR